MPENLDELERVRHVYNTVYRPDPSDRRYTWHPCNPVSVYYRQARERALIALLNDHNVISERICVLDVGCGQGSFLRFLSNLGAPPEYLHGFDLMHYRIERARTLCSPGISLHVGNAEALPYPDERFDLVSQFTVFSSILDYRLRERAAREMIRILKPGGYILWYDMRYSHTRTTRGIQFDEIQRLFPTCSVLTLRGLHPPYAARIVRRSWLLGELWARVPCLRRTHYLALLQKDGPAGKE